MNYDEEFIKRCLRNEFTNWRDNFRSETKSFKDWLYDTYHISFDTDTNGKNVHFTGSHDAITMFVLRWI